MSARRGYRHPVEWSTLGAMLARIVTGPCYDIVRLLTERDQHLEDFLRTLLPAESGLITGLTTDANGRITVTHGLRFTPAVIVASSMGPDGGGTILATVIVDQANITPTTFTARCFDLAGAPLALTAGLTVGWIATL